MGQTDRSQGEESPASDQRQAKETSGVELVKALGGMPITRVPSPSQPDTLNEVILAIARVEASLNGLDYISRHQSDANYATRVHLADELKKLRRSVSRLASLKEGVALLAKRGEQVVTLLSVVAVLLAILTLVYVFS